MTPLRFVEWTGAALAALLVVALAVDILRPRRRLVRATVADARGTVVSTVTHVIGDAAAEARLPDGHRLIVTSEK